MLSRKLTSRPFCVIYTHSMIDVSERCIMYGTYYHVRFVPRPGMFLLPLCVAGCYAHAGSIQPHNRLYLPTRYMSDVAILSSESPMPSRNVETLRQQSLSDCSTH
jgi:hypothetical protein